MKFNKIKILFISCALMVIIIFVYKQNKADLKPIFSKVNFPIAIINNHQIKLMIADEYTERVHGLSDKKLLEKNSGMLFIFPKKQIQNFWMKNMHFPIDIIWIADNKIVNISKNLQPEGEFPKKSYSSNLPVNYVLEVNAGYFDELKMKIGDEVNFSL